jgi:hypothetical protein
MLSPMVLRRSIGPRNPPPSRILLRFLWEIDGWRNEMMWKRRWKICIKDRKLNNAKLNFSVFAVRCSLSHDCMFTCKNPIKRYSSLYAKKNYIFRFLCARLNSHSKTVRSKIYEYSCSLLLISMCAPMIPFFCAFIRLKTSHSRPLWVARFFPLTRDSPLMRTFCSSCSLSHIVWIFNVLYSFVVVVVFAICMIVFIKIKRTSQVMPTYNGTSIRKIAVQLAYKNTTCT